MKKKKPYFHELSQKEIDKLIEKKVNVQYILDNYKQPKWCIYENALEAQFGCWTLMDLTPNGGRTKISEGFCKTCDCFKKEFHCQSEIEGESKCKTQCEHCIDYYKDIDELHF